MRNNESVRWIKFGYAALSVGLALFGALLALRPQLSLNLITNVAGGILICFGIIKIWGHFSNDLYRLAFQRGLATGLLAVAVGAVLLFRDQVVVSILCVILGFTALLDALTKIEMSMEARAFGLGSWWVILSVGLVAGVIGFLLILRPWDGAQMMISLLGAALFVEGILNLITSLTAIKISTLPTTIE